jgi:diguanylate cyclase (GGDEF)-like protein
MSSSNNNAPIDDDFIEFEDEEVVSPNEGSGEFEAWKILIVDDEEQVHKTTKFALSDFTFSNKPVEFIDCYSSKEAIALLEQQNDIACILLDVVMESQDAGLKLVGFIRDTLKNVLVRIILRTGQPGYAPELEVIQKYDINDYKAKNELTRSRLVTTVIASLRAYQQLQTIERSRQGLEIILQASSNLAAVRAVSQFATGALIQICSMLNIDAEGVLCARFFDDEKKILKVLAAYGHYDMYTDKSVDELPEKEMSNKLYQAIHEKKSHFYKDHAILYILSPGGDELVVDVATHHELTDLDKQLLELFSINIAVGFENAHLFEDVERLAFFDPLTGLPNRVHFQKALQSSIGKSEHLAVLLADIDDFQTVNDGLGHDLGNKTLIAVAMRLKGLMSNGQYIARISGDTFGILLHYNRSSELVSFTSRLNKIVGEPLVIGHSDIPLTMTIGIALSPDHGEDGLSLFQNAGIALKQAKQGKRGQYQLFNPQLEEDLRAHLQIIKELSHCVAKNQLRLLYQPQVNIFDGQIFGVEALVRWMRTETEQVLPSQFIPAAEDSGHIVVMGEWILREACQTQVGWRKTGFDIQMSVNVSIRQLREPDFITMVQQVISETGIENSKLELEVTETMVMEDAEEMIHLLNDIRALGIKISIDDFGTGYSSLAYLKRMPADQLKIDKAFVDEIHKGGESEVIAELIIAMGHLLDMVVIAEGVETMEQQLQLKDLGCDQVQGYLHSKPIPSDDLLEMLKNYQANPAE